MKTIKAPFYLVWIVPPIFIIIAALLYSFLTNHITNGAYIYWLPLLMVLIIAVLPCGKRRLAADDQAKPALSPAHWLAKIFALQIGSMALYYAIAALTLRILPVNNNFPAGLFNQGLHQFLLHFGLFPWGVFCLMAIAIGYCAYRKQQEAHLGDSTATLLPTKATQKLGYIINGIAKQNTILVIAFTLTIFSLLIASVLSKLGFTISHGINQYTVIFVIVLIILAYTKIGKRYTSQIFNSKIPLVLSYLLLTIALAIILSVYSFLIGMLHTPNSHYSFGLLNYLFSRNPHAVWMIFSLVWWLAWIPTIGIFIARWSRGHRIRSIVFAVLALPILFTVIFAFTSTQHPWVLTDNRWLALLIGFIGFLLFFGAIGKSSTSSLLMLSALPNTETIKHRSQQSFAQKCVQVTVLMFYAYLPGGLWISAPLLFLLVLPMFVIPILSTINLPFGLGKKAGD